MVKHETPADLDKLFEREEISREEYEAFWKSYWKKGEGRARSVKGQFAKFKYEKWAKRFVARTKGKFAKLLS